MAVRKSKHPGVYPSGSTTWQYRVSWKDPLTNKRAQEVRGGFPTDTAAHKARVQRLAELSGGIGLATSATTVDAWMQMWIAASRGTPGTIFRYKQNARLYIAPHLGDMPISKVSANAVSRWLRTLEAQGLAANTIRNVRTMLSAAMSAAYDDGLVKRNPVKHTAPPPPPKRKESWSTAQAEAFLAAADDDEYAALWRLLMFAHLRPGEALALRWTDLDMKARTVTPRSTRTIDGAGHVTRGTTAKTPSSESAVTFPESVAQALRQHADRWRFIRQQQPWLPESDLVFPGARAGGMMAHPTLCRRLDHLCRLTMHDGKPLPRITPHGLRHLGALLMMRAGVSAAVVSARLRHTSVAFTLDTYVEPTLDDQRDADDRLEKMLDQSG